MVVTYGSDTIVINPAIDSLLGDIKYFDNILYQLLVSAYRDIIVIDMSRSHNISLDSLYKIYANCSQCTENNKKLCLFNCK
jgi:hypothetical protein